MRTIMTWLKPNAVVSLTTSPHGEFILAPYSQSSASDVQWEEVWKRIYRSRALKGKRGNLSAYILRDRERQ